eukprot:TRINITY_DN1674_c0_g4_i2.p1 TRINITY_DN1674_c0_g4~~TRINITY_DN1674_c0_g4_i2.p1  ORF type:complete len:184 (+),score=14.64 TRINITY_DN1674_c0_g4_i2:225-776(+)
MSSSNPLLIYISNTLWERKIWPAIKKITVTTLLSVCEAIEHTPNSFELYGFDFVLDSDFHPWLLEVNLSPACSERTPWLTTMLDSMADGLIDIVSARLPIRTACKGASKISIYDMKKLMGKIKINIGSSDLTLSGHKTNDLYAKILDRHYMKEQAARVITRNAKMWLAKQKVKALKQLLSRIS